MASPTRSLFAPGKQARVSVSFSDRVAQAMNERCLELGCAPKDYVKYAVMRDLDAEFHSVRTCVVCGDEFRSRNKNRIYCGKTCTKRAERQRQAEFEKGGGATVPKF